jgi:hypothetical protein
MATLSRCSLSYYVPAAATFEGLPPSKYVPSSGSKKARTGPQKAYIEHFNRVTTPSRLHTRAASRDYK